jgi:hypothetical protein
VLLRLSTLSLPRRITGRTVEPEVFSYSHTHLGTVIDYAATRTGRRTPCHDDTNKFRDLEANKVDTGMRQMPLLAEAGNPPSNLLTCSLANNDALSVTAQSPATVARACASNASTPRSTAAVRRSSKRASGPWRNGTSISRSRLNISSATKARGKMIR